LLTRQHLSSQLRADTAQQSIVKRRQGPQKQRRTILDLTINATMTISPSRIRWVQFLHGRQRIFRFIIRVRHSQVAPRERHPIVPLEIGRFQDREQPGIGWNLERFVQRDLLTVKVCVSGDAWHGFPSVIESAGW
jgi:hypothetical protein